MEIIFLTTAFAAGLIVALLFSQGKIYRIRQKHAAEITSLQQEAATLQERLHHFTEEKEQLQQELAAERHHKEELLQTNAAQKVGNETLEERLRQQKKDLEELQKTFTLHFEHIATKILRENSQEVQATNQKRLQSLLDPLKEKITTFEKKVEETYERETRDKISLREEVKRLYELNHRISAEAHNLTRALRGDVKKQGNWGEVILERILERSGLTRGSEYRREVALHNDEGRPIRPDVIIDLPENSHVIVDAKVSLNAYDRYIEADSDNEKDLFIREHITALKNHVKELAKKHYPTAQGLSSPDFVLMFLPIESSFAIAVQHDQELFSYAWDNKIVIVSPSTLLATLRTVASIWKQEHQNKNVLEIAQKGGELYDKFVGFVTDIEKIGKQLGNAQQSYEAAVKKLYTGKGSLVRRTEQLKELGAKAKKQLPQQQKPLL